MYYLRANFINYEYTIHTHMRTRRELLYCPIQARIYIFKYHLYVQYKQIEVIVTLHLLYTIYVL